MKVQLIELQKAVETKIRDINSSQDLEALKVSILGKKGQLTDILKGLKDVSNEERPLIGQIANAVKTSLMEQLTHKKETLDKEALHQKLRENQKDQTLPGMQFGLGSLHPISQVIDELVGIFSQMGFSVKLGPDIESNYYNFEALNIPKDHPARDMHDTFYIDPERVLRTHTSSVQIRSMQKMKPPIRIIAPGKVYRCDSDVTHSPMFHQIEGLYVDEHVTFSELKGVLEYLLQTLFGQSLKIRFRPSYFPFTEPSTEVDVQCVHCMGKGCSFCKHTGWLEILGAGMVHRNVFRAVGLNPDEVTGFAFGMGIERIAMLKYQIPDIRLFFENDHRFLSQF